MVPDGWKSRPLQSVLRKPISYGIVQTGPVISGGIPCVRVVDLTRKNIDVSSMITTSDQISQSYKKTILERSEIMIALRGEIGLVRKVTSDLVGTNLTRGIARISPNEDVVDPDFLLWAMRSGCFRSNLLRRVNGSALQEIPIGELRQTQITFPLAVSEQKKIAKILSTWDKAIDTVERLIESSKAQKKALMQKLLLGSERLPGFEGEWNVRHVEEVAVIAVSPVDKKSSAGENPVRLCNYTDVYYNDHILDDMDFMVATASDNEIERFTLRQGDVVITKDSETPDDIAIPAYVEEELNGVVCGYHLAIIRPDENLADGQFLAYLFSLPHTRYYFFTLANGATRFGLGVESIRRASFCLPRIEEQKAIAKIIRTADTELSNLRRQLGLLRGEKKALMQQLLTGKRRVIPSKEA